MDRPGPFRYRSIRPIVPNSRKPKYDSYKIMRITLLRWEPWNDADWKRVVARDFHAFCVKIYRGAQRPRLGQAV